MEPDLITFDSTGNDLFFDGTDFVLLTNREALADRIRQALRLRRGSCLYDLLAGFDWQKLQGSDNPVLYNTLLRNFLNRFDFVTRINSLNVEFDLINRRAALSFEVETNLGEPVAVSFDTVVTI